MSLWYLMHQEDPSACVYELKMTKREQGTSKGRRKRVCEEKVRRVCRSFVVFFAQLPTRPVTIKVRRLVACYARQLCNDRGGWNCIRGWGHRWQSAALYGFRVVTDNVAQACTFCGVHGLRLVGVELGLQVIDSPLQSGFARQGGLEIRLVSVGIIARDFGVSASGLLTLLKLCDATTEEVVDDFEFAHASLQVAAVCRRVRVDMALLEMRAAVQGSSRGRWLAQRKGRE